MSEENKDISSKEKKPRINREEVIKNVKTGGSLVMYIGSAGLVAPIVRKSREQQNGVVQACSIGAGTVISLGLGNLATKWMNRAIDDLIDFWDDVKSKRKKKKQSDDREDIEQE